MEDRWFRLGDRCRYTAQPSLIKRKAILRESVISSMFVGLYRILFLVSGLGVLWAAYILFAYLTMGDYGFNMHPILHESNLGIGLAVVFGWPIMVAAIVIHLLCWANFAIRRKSRRPTADGRVLESTPK